MAENANDIVEFTDADWDTLEDLASQLEDAWAKGGLVDLAKFVPPSDSPLRKAALHELVKVDLECRWRKGQSVSLEYYIDKFADLGKARDLPAKLVFEEYRVRQLFGDRPSIEIYKNRFPGQYEQLQRFLTDEPLPTVIHAGTIGKIPKKAKNVSKTENEKTKNEQTAKEVGAAPTYATVIAPPKPQGFKDNVQQVGDFRMIERLGAGAFGEVWKAELPGGIMKAVKVIFRPIDHEEAKRELESLELIKGLRHHFLLQTISFRPCEDRLFILMDLADGSLRDQLKAAKKEGKTGLPLQDLVRWTREASEALDYLHDKGVQHRDIKPENILLSEGNVRVADFGLARHQATRRLASGSGAGTPLYMPPEAWNDKVHANSDQYSLAATYAECRLGRRIYDSDGLASLMQAHIHEKPKLDPLPPDEKKVLIKALAKNPDHRYPTCRAFADDLMRAAMKTLPPGTFGGMPMAEIEMPGLTRRQREKQKQTRGILYFVGFLSLLMVGAIVASILTRSDPAPQDLVFLPSPSQAGPFRAVEGTEMIEVAGKKYPKQIDCQIADTPDLVVRFNYVPWPEQGKQPFYLMENMVSNDVYEAFAKANPSAVNGSRWRLGARAKFTELAPIYPIVGLFAGPPVHWNFAAMRVLYPRASPPPFQDDLPPPFFQEDWPQPDDFGASEPRWPVLRIDVQEAQQCAKWLGGWLPSAAQWDQAAGRNQADPKTGPFEMPFEEGTVAVNREGLGPLPVGTATRDKSAFSGCRDMAGNGLEWTRTFRFDGNVGEFFDDLKRVPLLAKIPLRGRSYNSVTPLTFFDLEDRPLDLEFFQTFRIPGNDSFIGFRVAIMP
jgi:formylglycine-generating enzyme required for sulfatase activity